MKQLHGIIMVCMAVWLLAVGPPAFADSVGVEGLRCEHLEDPLGIDAIKPRLSWKLKDPAATRGQRQTAYQILVASSPELLEQKRGDLWDSGKVISDESVLVAYAGAPLGSRQACWWRVRVWDMKEAPSDWSRPARWTMGLLRTNDWQAQWISTPLGTGKGKSEPWFRREFVLPEPPARAFAYVASIGYHELYVNGRKVSDAVLTPAVANYRKRVRYVTYDLTSLLRGGTNCVGLWLGSGWSTLSNYQLKDGAMVLAQVEAELPGGGQQRLVTGADWKTHDSPITATGTFNPRFVDPQCFGGEIYDATLDQPNWCQPHLDEAGWEPAKVFPPQPQTVSAEMIEPDRLLDVLKPVAITRTTNGAARIDLGRSFTGWLNLPLHGTNGQRVTIEYSEREDEDCTYNQRDTYVCAGRAGEQFQNHFNYRAFRWVTVRGLDAHQLPATNEITGWLVRSDYRVSGDFECSDPLLNRIYQACQWTFQSLSLGGYTVDCPHRERFGYGGDAHVVNETGLSRFDLSAFYTKWLMDWRDCQEPSGEMPHTAPQYGGGGGPSWGGICVVLPWELYLRQGDRGILETSYPSIQKWLEFLESKAGGNLLRHFTSVSTPGQPQWSFLGDWLAPHRGQEPGERVDDNTVLFFNNCYWLLNLDLTARIADVLGKNDDAARYRARLAEISRTVQAQFFNTTNNSYANGEQPYLVFPLMTGVTPTELRPRVQEQLVHTILETDKGHINSGGHGAWLLFNYLMAKDRNDLIYTMVSQTNHPSWGYMLAQGATTIWEEWNGNNSRLHSTQLSVGNWFSEGIAGIRPDPARPGYKRFLVQPAPVGGLTQARASFESPYGMIRSDWRVEAGILKLDLQVPPNSSAWVSLPTRAAASVREQGRTADKSRGVRFLHQQDDRAIFECVAGHYAFTTDSPIPLLSKNMSARR
jgi:alpha-L-rhamnosidase